MTRKLMGFVWHWEDRTLEELNDHFLSLTTHHTPSSCLGQSVMRDTHPLSADKEAEAKSAR